VEETSGPVRSASTTSAPNCLRYSKLSFLLHILVEALPAVGLAATNLQLDTTAAADLPNPNQSPTSFSPHPSAL